MRLLRRLSHWIRLRSNHAELADELAFHREMIERDFVQRGLSPDDARDAARRAMGNETFMREEARAVWLMPSLEALWQDATYTLRGLRRNPTFALGVTITLALGIGANAAMFSLVDRLLFRPPALMADPASVHRVYLFRTIRGKESQTGFPYPRFADIARSSTEFSQTAGFSMRELGVRTGDATRLMPIAVVSAEFFRFFDAPPLRGRYFAASEDAPPDGAPVAVLTKSAWKSQFGSREDILGTAVQIGPVKYTIIGVAPEKFVGLWPYRPPVAFIPLATFAASDGRNWTTNYGRQFGLEMMVRRKPEISVSAATADLTNAFLRSYQTLVATNPRATPASVARPRAVAASILTERGPEPSSVARIATWVSGVTVIVLLIACANVANLLLARTLRRRREVAVRVALGVSRARLFWQLITEGVLLALLGGVASLAVAVWGSEVLRAAFLPGTERVSLITDSRTLLFVGAVAIGTGFLTGIVPVLQAGRLSLMSDLKAGAREGTYQRARLRTLLLVTQAALSVVLLVGAGLFVRSMRNVRDVKLGFDPEPVLVVSLANMRITGFDSAAATALRLRLLAAAGSVPGVAHASLQEAIPLAGSTSWPIFVTGIDSVSALGEFNFNTVSADYFATMGTRILRGRGFQATDIDGAQRVAVIGESMGAALWPGQNPLGRCLRVGLTDSAPCIYVVGVAEDIHSHTIEPESKTFSYYLPAAQWYPQEGGLFVRAKGDANGLVEPLRRRLQREMPGASFVTVTRLADVVDAKMRSWRLGATVFTAFGVLALVLAAVGLYSVIAYNVVQRKHELGVRVALGAGRAAVVRLVMAQALRFAVAGVVIGGAIALAAGKWIAPLLFNQSPRDPAVFGIVICALLGVAAAASSVPALRAASVDPKTALQSD
jgi:predicted permease